MAATAQVGEPVTDAKGVLLADIGERTDAGGRVAAADVDIRAFNHIETTPGSAPEGDLRGMTIGVKDNIDVAGMPTTASSQVLQGNVAERDATVVARLRAAGAAFIGKTNLDEFAYGTFSPPTRNPWDPKRIPGGSSGGSAAAVAAGMCVAALGTDTAGSIRIPAALCGVFGLTPRRPGDMTGIIPLAPSLDRCGPLARDPNVLAKLWTAMDGRRVERPRDEFTVAVLDVNGLHVDTEVVSRYSDFVSALQADETCTVVGKAAPPTGRWERPGGIVLMWEALVEHRERRWFPARAELYSPDVRRNLGYATTFEAAEVDEARSAMDGLRQEYAGLMDEVDVVLTPTTPCVAPRFEEITVENRRSWIKHLGRTAAHLNFCSLAAVTIPLWSSDSHLPWGIDAIARDEWTALDFAAAHAPQGVGSG